MNRLVVVGCAALIVACGSETEPAGSGDGGGSSVSVGGSAGATSVGGNGVGGTSSVGGSGGSAPTGPQVDLSDPQLYEFELDPNVLDPSTVDSLETQYAQLDTRTTPVGQLVIFLTGATNVPAGWRDHGRKLAEFGYHVLIPHYDNRWSSMGACSGMPSGCSVNTRWEALTGEDTSSAVTISRADSAEGRVVTMLQHLTTAHPQGDWGWFLLPGDELRYSDIVIAGISHGASSTGLYAERRSFARAVLHSGGAAGDTQAQKLTPIDTWYAFAHTGDPAYAAITNSWDAHGLLGSVTSIDGASAPFANAHKLSASTTSSYPHCSVAVHSSSPTVNNAYVFEEAWRYLYGVAP